MKSSIFISAAILGFSVTGAVAPAASVCPWRDLGEVKFKCVLPDDPKGCGPVAHPARIIVIGADEPRIDVRIVSETDDIATGGNRGWYDSNAGVLHYEPDARGYVSPLCDQITWVAENNKSIWVKI